MAEILDGKRLASTIRDEIRGQVSLITESHGIVPGLSVVIVGDNPASWSYIKGKQKACQEVGFHSVEVPLPESISQDELIRQIHNLNANPSIHGILVQLPLPRHIDSQKVLEEIVPEKDVDGFHPQNVGNLLIGSESFVPCTPLGIMEILKRYNIKIEGRNAIVVGRSNIVGKPVAVLLMRENATVTIAHSRTCNLDEEIRRADIVIAALGRPKIILGSWIKKGAVVIDVGINRIADPSKPSGVRLVGDVDFDSANQVASYITPVPGGVGPMTNAMLLFNTLKARNGLSEKEERS